MDSSKYFIGVALFLGLSMAVESKFGYILAIIFLIIGLVCRKKNEK